jgi:hypothetical protein
MAGKKKSGGSVDFKVTASGLNKVEKDAKKAGKSFNQLDKNASSADRAGKGVAQMSSNVTKNFSKMSQGITGGLVPAYATLAAQLFAIDALFRFLKDAADFRVLTEGQEAFAAVTGRAMKTIAREIQAATAAQITFKEASQAAAIGLAAGLSPEQLKELGESAKIVSVALGRDVTDSFNRLVRGVTKAEPELLDELGIILRLEEASIRYASALGLNKNQLTTFQKSQAVANEVLRQSEERYGAIAEILGDDSVNQLNKLTVAFDEVLNNFRNFIGPIAEFFGGFLVENIESATAALGVFAATISGGLIRQAIPQIDTSSMSKVVNQNLEGFLVAGEDGSPQENRRQKLIAGEGSAEDIRQIEKGLKAKNSKLVHFNTVRKADAAKTMKFLKIQELDYQMSSAIGMKRLRLNFQRELLTMQYTHGRVMGAMKLGFITLGRVANGVMRLAGFIGIAVMIVQMAKSMYDSFNKVDKTIEKLQEKTQAYTETQRKLNEELERTAKVFREDMFSTRSQEIEAIGNAFQSADLVARINDFNSMRLALGANNEKVVAFKDELKGTFNTLGEFDSRFREFGEQLEKNPDLLENSTGEMSTLSQQYIFQGQAVKSLTEATANFNKQLNQYIQSIPKVAYQDVLMSQEQMLLSLVQLKNATGNTAEETADYGRQIDIVTGKMEAYKMLSRSALQVQIAMTKAQAGAAMSTNAIFGEKETVQRALKTAQGMEKMFKAQTVVYQAEQNLEAAKTDTEKEVRRAQLKLAKEQEELTLNQLAATAMMENAFVRINKTILEGLTNALGKSLGKALRGEKDAFKDFGKTLANQLTDQMGKQVAENIMKITYGGTPLDPRFQQQIFKRQLKESFDEGFTDKDSPLQRGGTDIAHKIRDEMIYAANQHIQGLHNAKVGLAKAEMSSAQQNVINQEGVVEGYNNTIERYKSGGFIEKEQQDNLASLKEAEERKLSIIQDFIDEEFDSRVKASVDAYKKAKAEGGSGVGSTGSMYALSRITEDAAVDRTDLINNPKYKQAVEDIEKYEGKQQDLSKEVETSASKFSDANAKIDGANKALDKMKISLISATKAFNTLTGGKTDPLPIPDGSTTGTTNTGDGNTTTGNGEPGPAYIDSSYYGKKAQDLFPETFKALGDGSGEMTMGQNALKFGTAITQFATLTAQGFALAGKQEEAADIMLEVAKIQMALAMAEMANNIGSLFAPARYGGIMSPSGKSFSGGGVAEGPEAGYNATLHGTEAVVPLGNDRSIPVKMSGSGGTNNVNVTVNVDQGGQSQSVLTGDGARELGKTIAAIAQDTIAKEQRAGGLLSSI